MKHLERFKNDISGKTVGVVGIGVSNTPIITMLTEMGVKVLAFDKRPRERLGDPGNVLEQLGIKMVCGDDYMEHLSGDWIIKTPGMRFDHPALLKAKERGSKITSEMELFFEYCPCPIVAVTGSDGKTTTTSLIFEMLRRTDRKVHLGGNIGYPLFCRLGQIGPEDLVVAELSSFQLHTLQKSPYISVVTNLSPNHLDVHKGMEEYTEAKANIFRYQQEGDVLVLNADNAVTAGFASRAKGKVRLFSFHTDPGGECAFYQDGAIFLRDEAGTLHKLLDRSQLLLRGDHNVENFMAALLAVWGLCSTEIMLDVAENFGGVRHRMEFVGEINGVKFYNDSIGSSPTRTIATLHSFDRRVRLIAGGYDKKIPYDELGPVVCDRVEKLYLCGDTAPLIQKAVLRCDPDFPIDVFKKDLKKTVKAAYADSKPGDIVLLSPASASFDQFKNFEERGDYFVSVVKELK
ncbi:MAG: UDP-N-acetylmuramoyl-L-alanine--D-glutamate ligase [Clostridia bacterium]|nr:UDP-N-acetylmuramoyl-L-alanine--D-glutamate ligase [Clostridia bacterium]